MNKRPNTNLSHFTTALAIAGGLWLSQAGAFAAAELTKAEKEFFKDASESGMMEVKIGELAGKKGASSDAKMMGEHLVKDHTKANGELEKLASAKGVTLSKEMTAADKSKFDALEKEEGAKFDSEFNATVVKSHKKAIALFEKTAKDAKDSDVKAFAEKMLPDLKGHLAMAEKHDGMKEHDMSGKHEKTGDNDEKK